LRQDCRFHLLLLVLPENRQFLIYTVFMTLWSPKEITQHQALVSTIFYVYLR